MATTPEGRRLTQDHQQEQVRVRASFLAEYIALWALLDTARLDETSPGWVAAVMRAVRAYRQISAEVSADYFAAFAAVEAPSSVARPRVPDLSRPQTEPPAPRTGRPPRADRGANASPRATGRTRERRPSGRDVIPDVRRSGVRFEFDEDAYRRSLGLDRTRIEIPEIDWTPRDRAAKVSLEITGPIGQKVRIKKGLPPAKARDSSFVESSGAASRHVLDGGRQSMMKLITDDMRLQGYIRVTGPDPCYFCAMLASRGPVYRTPNRARADVRGPRNARAGDAFVGEGVAKVHDHCQCTIEPVWSTDAGWPGRGREFQQLWNEHIRGQYSGADAIRAWRRLYDRLQREQRLVA